MGQGTSNYSGAWKSEVRIVALRMIESEWHIESQVKNLCGSTCFETARLLELCKRTMKSDTLSEEEFTNENSSFCEYKRFSSGGLKPTVLHKSDANEKRSRALRRKKGGSRKLRTQHQFDCKKGRRIGEAKHPGPITHGLDDSDGSCMPEEYEAGIDELFEEADWLQAGEDKQWQNLPTDKELFIKADKFSEKKSGYVFKKGEKGLGYYVDGITEISIYENLRRSIELAPIKVELDQLVESSPEWQPAGPSTVQNSNNRKSKQSRSGPLDCRNVGGNNGNAVKEAQQKFSELKVANKSRAIRDGMMA